VLKLKIENMKAISRNAIRCRFAENIQALDYFTKQSVFWALHATAKLGQRAVQETLSFMAPNPRDEMENEARLNAVYLNSIPQFEWIRDAFGTTTVNMMQQHTQMRQELQSRHQDITNDVNQYTTCMSNFLGIQIFTALPDATADPLDSKCRGILGLSGRRLEEGDKENPFNLGVTWGSDSFVSKISQQTEILENLKEKWDDLQSKWDNLQSKLDGITQSVEDVKDRLPTVSDPNEGGAGKSKPRPKAKKHKVDNNDVVEDTDAEDQSNIEHHLFERNLLDTVDYVSNESDIDEKMDEMTEKLDSVESEIKTANDALNAKVESMKGEVDAIKGKVEKIENSIEDIKDMLSKLLTAGGVAAG